MKRRIIGKVMAAAVMALLAASVAICFLNAAVAQTAPVEPLFVVLDSRSVWHSYTALKPPVVQVGGALKPVTSPYPWVDQETPPAPEGWTARGFADESWLRGPAQSGPHTPYASNIYLRAKFDVTDPAQVKDLKLSVTYHGGAIVYVNGHEIGRGNLPKDAKEAGAVAESYPSSVFVQANGEIVLDSWGYHGPKEALTGRNRQLTDLAVPATALKKGVNVLAIEAIRAPYDQSVAEYWDKSKRKEGRELGEPGLPYDFNWYTCEVKEVKLTASGPAGLAANAGRAKELQAWNSDLLTSDTCGDLGDRCEPLRPVAIKGPRNGWASGKVVLGSPKAIEGLKVTCGDLKQGAAVIPAAALRARFAVSPAEQPEVDTPLESLLEKPLPSFPVARGGAVVPIWLTVKVPATAKPGAYAGQVTVEVKGEKTLVVPVTLQVAAFTVPDTQDYQTWIELMQSPDTLALEYNVPLWSDQHWDLIAQSMRYIGEIGSRVVILPLLAQTNAGNSESLVRWIKKDDGSYDYDLSLLDKYLDLAVKNMGRPKFVVLTAWEIYLATPKTEVKVSDQEKMSLTETSWSAARWDLRNKGPAVTALDPKTGQTATVNLPRFEEKSALAIWKPLFDRLHQDLARRGLEKTMLLGMTSDVWPNQEEMVVLDKASGGLPWINHSHQGPMGNALAGGLGHVVYTAYVWPNEYPGNPAKPRVYGWKRPDLFVEFRRFTAFNDYLLPTQMIFPELEITGKQRGLGRIGADFWPALKDKKGRRRGYVWEKYPQSLWHSCNLMSHMLNPGPDGPVATSRYEMLREGLQNCEARITIEKVLTDETQKAKLGGDLAAKSQKLLDERLQQALKGFSGLQLTGRIYTTYAEYGKIFYYNAGGPAGAYWYAESGWQEREQQLYALAGEVQEKIGGK